MACGDRDEGSLAFAQRLTVGALDEQRRPNAAAFSSVSTAAAIAHRPRAAGGGT